MFDRKSRNRHFYRWGIAIAQLMRWGLSLLALTVLGVACFAALIPSYDAQEIRPTDVIVVLGGGMEPDGRLHRSSALRVDRGVALWKSGVAPQLHFTGGVGMPDGLSAGAQMAARALAQGVPEAAITIETRSHSTLQNALFSQPMLEGASQLTLVTEGFHLPRSWLSFKWAKPNVQLSLVYSTRFRQGVISGTQMMLREGLAIWFNIARALIHGGAGLLGIPPDIRDPWLA